MFSGHAASQRALLLVGGASAPEGAEPLLLDGQRLGSVLLLRVDVVLVEGDGVGAQFEPVQGEQRLDRLRIQTQNFINTRW